MCRVLREQAVEFPIGLVAAGQNQWPFKCGLYWLDLHDRITLLSHRGFSGLMLVLVWTQAVTYFHFSSLRHRLCHKQRLFPTPCKRLYRKTFNLKWNIGSVAYLSWTNPRKRPTKSSYLQLRCMTAVYTVYGNVTPHIHVVRRVPLLNSVVFIQLRLVVLEVRVKWNQVGTGLNMVGLCFSGVEVILRWLVWQCSAKLYGCRAEITPCGPTHLQRFF